MDPLLKINIEKIDTNEKLNQNLNHQGNSAIYRKISSNPTIYHNHTHFRRATAESPLVSVHSVSNKDFNSFVLQSKRKIEIFIDGRKTVLHSSTGSDLSCPISIRSFASKQNVSLESLVYVMGAKDGNVFINTGQNILRKLYFPQEISSVSFIGFQEVAVAHGNSIEILDFVRQSDVWSTHGQELEGVSSSSHSKSRSKNTKQLVSQIHEDKITSLLQVQKRGNPKIFISGSYDKNCILWDIRSPISQSVVNKWSHEYPIECVINGEANQIITAGGEFFKIWDIRNINKGPIVERAAHQNTITNIKYYSSDKVLITSSLDEHLNFYDSSTGLYSLQHSIKLSSPLSDFAFSNDRKTLFATSTGKHYFKSVAVETKVNQLLKKHLDTSTKMWKSEIHPLWVEQLMRMSEEKDKILMNSHLFSKYRKLLDTWQYKKALTAIMTKESENPVVGVAFIELMRIKRYTHEALSNRNDVQLLPILQFVNRYISDSKFTRILIPFFEVILDIYGEVIGLSPPIDQEMKDIRRQINEGMKKIETLQKLKGAYSFFLSLKESGNFNKSSYQIESFDKNNLSQNKEEIYEINSNENREYNLNKMNDDNDSNQSESSNDTETDSNSESSNDTESEENGSNRVFIQRN